MLKPMGVTVMKKLNGNHLDKIADWIKSKKTVHVDYPDNAKEIIDLIVKNHLNGDVLDTNHESTNYNFFQ